MTDTQIGWLMSAKVSVNGQIKLYSFAVSYVDQAEAMAALKAKYPHAIDYKFCGEILESARLTPTFAMGDREVREIAHMGFGEQPN